MWLLDPVRNWIRGAYRAVVRSLRPNKRTESYTSIVCDDAPEPHAVGSGVVHIVHANGKSRWAMLRCPCGCDDVITLSLQPVHTPHWRVLGDAPEKPGLYPSIWRKEGCCSHFWITKGRVHWA